MPRIRHLDRLEGTDAKGQQVIVDATLQQGVRVSGQSQPVAGIVLAIDQVSQPPAKRRKRRRR